MGEPGATALPSNPRSLDEFTLTSSTKPGWSVSGLPITRRTRPVAAFWVNSAAVVALTAAGYSSDVYQWTNLVVTYSIAAYGTSRQAWVALPALVGGVVFYFVRFPSEGSLSLATAKEQLDAESRRRKLLETKRDLLSRMRDFFGLSDDASPAQDEP